MSGTRVRRFAQPDEHDPVIIQHTHPANSSTRSAAPNSLDTANKKAKSGSATRPGCHSLVSIILIPRCAYASLPEAGAGCGKSARPDLCGGRGVIRIPTATVPLRFCLSRFLLPPVSRSRRRPSFVISVVQTVCVARGNGRICVDDSRLNVATCGSLRSGNCRHRIRAWAI